MENESKQPQQKRMVLGVTVTPDLQARVAMIASERDWSIAKTAGYLIKLGLQKFDEPEIPEATPSASQTVSAI